MFHSCGEWDTLCVYEDKKMSNLNLPPEITKFVKKMELQGTPIQVLNWEQYERIMEVEYRYDQKVKTMYIRTETPMSDEKIE